MRMIHDAEMLNNKYRNLKTRAMLKSGVRKWIADEIIARSAAAKILTAPYLIAQYVQNGFDPRGLGI
jgi:hypothetical protein